jgi:hypothetical protein
MKKLAYLLPAFCLAAASMSANADTLKFVSSNGTTGPYSMQFNGTPLNLFCIDDQRTVSPGESWAVTEVSGADYYTTNTKSTDFKYEEEAYILSEETSSNHLAVQDALWAIFDTNDHLSKGSAAADLVADAAKYKYTTSFLSGYDFYIPVDPGGRHDPSDWDGNGIPQEFIGQNPDPAPTPTPEPSTLALFGSGLVGMAGIVRRRLARG